MAFEHYKENAEKCLLILRNAKTDNEKIAGLMLVPKLILLQRAKSTASNSTRTVSVDSTVSDGVKDGMYEDTGDPSEPTSMSDQHSVEESQEESIILLAFLKDFKKMLVEALGFHFIMKLLKCSESNENSGGLRCLSLSVLACLFTDGVLDDGQLQLALSTIEELLLTSVDITNGNVTNQNVAELCIACLEAMAQDQTKEAIDGILLPTVYRAFMKLKDTGIGAVLVQISKHLVQSNGQSWLSSNSKFAVCAMHLQYINFKAKAVTLATFDLCDLTARLLMSLETRTLPVKLHTLADESLSVLCDVLLNKILANQRQSCLKLLCALLQFRGIQTLLKLKGNRPALLLIHLCSIEVRMILEQDDLDRISKEEELLSACFFALEQMIFFMVHEETTLNLSSKEILQVHAALQGAVSADLYFLSNFYIEKPTDPSLHNVVIACIRLLGAWTAEETESLQCKYTKTLPSLLNICGILMEQFDSFKFLVPGLSNLTTDSEACVKAIVEDLPFMCHYIRYCGVRIDEGQTEYEHIVVNVCIILLNAFSMAEVTIDSLRLVEVFKALGVQAIAAAKAAQISDCPTALSACALTACKRLNECCRNDKIPLDPQLLADELTTTVYRHCASHLLHLYDTTTKYEKSPEPKSSENNDQLTPTVSEIWVMGMQVLTELMTLNEQVFSILTEEENIRKAMQLFDKFSNQVDAVHVLERLLLKIAESGDTTQLIRKVHRLKT